MSNSLYKVTPSPNYPPLASDVNQFIDAFNGSNDIGAIKFAAPLSAPVLAAPTVSQTLFSDALTEYTGSSASQWTIQSGSFTFGTSGATSGSSNSTMTAGSKSWSPSGSLTLTVQTTITTPSTLSGFTSVQLFQNASNKYYAEINMSSKNFYIAKSFAGTASVISSGVSLSTLAASSSYTITLSIDTTGNLTAKVYNGVGTAGTLMGTATVTDTSLSNSFLISVSGDTGVIFTNALVTGASNAATTTGTALGIGNYYYNFTYVVGYKKSNNTIVYGNETSGGSTNSIATTSGNQAVTLSNLPTTWPSTAIAMRIYRTAVNGTDGTQKLLTTLTSPVATYTDTIADSSLGVAIPATNTTGTSLGANNQDVVIVKGLEVNTDTRSSTLTYTNGLLTQVVEKDGATVVKTTNLTYTSGNLTQVQEIVGANTITSTLAYTNGNLTSVTRSVI